VTAAAPTPAQAATPRRSADRSSPLRALEDALLPALARTPCLIAFSGGRDSSAILAVAVRAATREGLADPIPITLRFPGRPETEEAAWQELVVRHLGIAEWERLEIDDELDFLGAFARRNLVRHGVLYPANVHFSAPLLERAGAGSLVTGGGGDDALGGWPGGRVTAVMRLGRAPERRDALRLARAVAPGVVKGVVAARRATPPPWLTPEAGRALRRAIAGEAAETPQRWRRWVPWLAARRHLAMARWSIERLARDTGTDVVHPFLDPGFLAALAGAGRPGALSNRTSATRELFGDLLPPGLVERETKAYFGDAYWGAHSRGFTRDWDGRGVDPRLVDAEALRRSWDAEWPDISSALLLQSAWLAAQPDRAPA
jgi:asparagine synthetase B (glutamine-hydrolysing)